MHFHRRTLRMVSQIFVQAQRLSGSGISVDTFLSNIREFMTAPACDFFIFLTNNLMEVTNLVNGVYWAAA